MDQSQQDAEIRKRLKRMGFKPIPPEELKLIREEAEFRQRLREDEILGRDDWED